MASLTEDSCQADVDRESYIQALTNHVITHIMEYLPFSDRHNASLVNKVWYAASLSSSLHFKRVFILRETLACDLDDSELHDECCVKMFIDDLYINSSVGGSIQNLRLEVLMSETLLVDILQRSRNLNTLTMSFCCQIFKGTMFPANCKELCVSTRNITKLDFSFNDSLSSSFLENVVSVCENLKVLRLAHTGLNMWNQKMSSSCLLKILTDRADNLHSVDLTGSQINDETLGHFIDVENLHLKELNLSDCDVTDHGITLLCRYQVFLGKLDLSGCKIGNQSLVEISCNLKMLEDLKICQCCPITDEGISCLRDLQKLRCIDLSRMSQISSNAFSHALCLQKSALRKLDVSHCDGVDDKFIKSLCDCCQLLESLDISVCRNITDCSLQGIIQNLVQLRVLKFPNCGEITDDGLCQGYNSRAQALRDTSSDFLELSEMTWKSKLDVVCDNMGCTSLDENGVHLFNVTHIQVLDLSYNNLLTDGCLRQVIKFNKLRDLDLSGLGISDGTLRVIACNNPSLEIIRISGCDNITDDGIEQLVSNVRRLNILYMSYVRNVTDASLHHIEKHCKHLRYLDVRDCFNISKDAERQLRRRMSLRIFSMYR